MGILIAVAFIAALAGFVWLLVRAFNTGLGWGLAVLFLSPFSAIAFAIKYWDQARNPFLIYIGASIAAGVIASSMMVGWMADQLPDPNASPEATAQAIGLSDQELIELKLVEQSIPFLEKLAKSDKDREIIATMLDYVAYRRSGGTEVDYATVSSKIDALLARSDLNGPEKESLRKMLSDVEGQNLRLAVKRTPAAPAAAAAAPATAPVASVPAQPDAQNRSTPPANDAVVASAPRMEEGSNHRFSQEPVSASEPEPAAPTVVPVGSAARYVGAEVTLVTQAGDEKRCYVVKVSAGSIDCERQIPGGTFSFSFSRSEIRSLLIDQ